MLRELIDRVYPSDLYCICCGKIIDGTRTYRLCDDCMKFVKWNTGRTCVKCGRRLSDNNPNDMCYNCRENEHVFRKGYSVAEYGTHERYVVMGFKYGDKLQIGETMGEMLADRMLAALGPDKLPDAYDLLVPVPLSRRRELARGYNQAAIIAAHFAQTAKLNIRNLDTRKTLNPKIIEPLSRIRETSAMKGLTPTERAENIKGSFAVKYGKEDMIKGARCLIIDDIYTTGATIDEIARTLYNAGAESVDFLTFASGADVIK